MNQNLDYVWYVGYGSNLSKQRFLCYILGETPKYGKNRNQGCTNRTLPLEDRPIKIPYSLYFSLPQDKKETSNWGKGGVAFITPFNIKDENYWTLGRMWKITKGQYDEIKKQEGPSWYNYEISIGVKNGISIFTITNKSMLNNNIPPSERYFKTIALGLKETYKMNKKEISEYLVKKIKK